MAISGTSTNYVDRKKDISILQYPDATIVGAQDMRVEFDLVTKYCSGIQKLAQKYVIILFTNIGSQKYYPDFGTEFLWTLQAGISPTDKIAAAQIFNLASYDAVNTLKRHQAERDNIPLDERIASASLEDISLYGGSVSFSVQLNTEASTGVTFLIPLPKL